MTRGGVLERWKQEKISEKAFNAAFRLVEGYGVAQSDLAQRQAKAHLQSIPRSSRFYSRAQAYLVWLKSEAELRQATAAYDSGDHRQAFRLLSDAFNHDALPASSLDTMRQLHAKWSRVVRALERGSELKDAGRYPEAIAVFEEVLKAEPNAKNALHVRAREEIAVLRAVTVRSDKRGKDQLRAAFKKEDWRAFHVWAKALERGKNTSASERAWIREAVAEDNTRLKLYKRCYRAFQQDEQEKFVWCDSVLQVLATWLPETDAKGQPNRVRIKAQELWTKVRVVIKRWQKLHGGEDE